MMFDLRSTPWWTPADRAELAVYVHELVDDVHEHRVAGCEPCSAGYPPCPWVRAAVERIIEWRDDRVLRSRAAWLREREDRLDHVDPRGDRASGRRS
jgi:hypothetical protein